MSTENPLDRLFPRYPILAVLGYAAIVVLLALVALGSAADLYDRNAALAAATDLLDQIEGRKASAPGTTFAGAPAGSPFLEGQTITVAGAALQQRITAAVSKVGGNVLSSQVDLTGTLSKEGFVSLVASCELEQPAVQLLLYDLEAGMPFLFIDQLVVQAPEGGTGAEASGGRMRVAARGVGPVAGREMTGKGPRLPGRMNLVPVHRADQPLAAAEHPQHSTGITRSPSL